MNEPSTLLLTATTSGPEETREFAGEMARLLEPGDLLLLEGDLGAGKTTFVQGLAVGLGVTEPVASPTFTLMRIYECPGAGPIERLLHADLYRLEHLSEVVDLGLLELVDDAAVAVVEWGDAGVPVFGSDFLEIRIDRTGSAETDRRITVSGTASWSGRAGVMSALAGSA